MTFPLFLPAQSDSVRQSQDSRVGLLAEVILGDIGASRTRKALFHNGLSSLSGIYHLFCSRIINDIGIFKGRNALFHFMTV